MMVLKGVNAVYLGEVDGMAVFSSGNWMLARSSDVVPDLSEGHVVAIWVDEEGEKFLPVRRADGEIERAKREARQLRRRLFGE